MSKLKWKANEKNSNFRCREVMCFQLISSQFSHRGLSDTFLRSYQGTCATRGNIWEPPSGAEGVPETTWTPSLPMCPILSGIHLPLTHFLKCLPSWLPTVWVGFWLFWSSTERKCLGYVTIPGTSEHTVWSWKMETSASLSLSFLRSQTLLHCLGSVSPAPSAAGDAETSHTVPRLLALTSQPGWWTWTQTDLIKWRCDKGVSREHRCCAQEGSWACMVECLLSGKRLVKYKPGEEGGRQINNHLPNAAMHSADSMLTAKEVKDTALLSRSLSFSWM